MKACFTLRHVQYLQLSSQAAKPMASPHTSEMSHSAVNSRVRCFSVTQSRGAPSACWRRYRIISVSASAVMTVRCSWSSCTDNKGCYNADAHFIIIIFVRGGNDITKRCQVQTHCWAPIRITGTCDPWLGTQLSQGYHCLREATAVDAVVCGSVLQWLGRCIAYRCALLGQCSLSFTFREIQIALVRLCLAMCQEWC